MHQKKLVKDVVYIISKAANLLNESRNKILAQNFGFFLFVYNYVNYLNIDLMGDLGDIFMNLVSIQYEAIGEESVSNEKYRFMEKKEFKPSKKYSTLLNQIFQINEINFLYFLNRDGFNIVPFMKLFNLGIYEEPYPFPEHFDYFDDLPKLVDSLIAYDKLPDILRTAFLYQVIPELINFFSSQDLIEKSFLPFLKDLKSKINTDNQKEFFYSCCSTIFYSYCFLSFIEKHIKPIFIEFKEKEIFDANLFMNYIESAFKKASSAIPFYCSSVLSIIPSEEQKEFIKNYLIIPLFSDPALFYAIPQYLNKFTFSFVKKLDGLTIPDSFLENIQNVFLSANNSSNYRYIIPQQHYFLHQIHTHVISSITKETLEAIKSKRTDFSISNFSNPITSRYVESHPSAYENADSYCCSKIVTRESNLLFMLNSPPFESFQSQDSIPDDMLQAIESSSPNSEFQTEIYYRDCFSSRFDPKSFITNTTKALKQHHSEINEKFQQYAKLTESISSIKSDVDPFQKPIERLITSLFNESDFINISNKYSNISNSFDPEIILQVFIDTYEVFIINKNYPQFKIFYFAKIIFALVYDILNIKLDSYQALKPSLRGLDSYYQSILPYVKDSDSELKNPFNIHQLFHPFFYKIQFDFCQAFSGNCFPFIMLDLIFECREKIKQAIKSLYDFDGEDYLTPTFFVINQKFNPPNFISGSDFLNQIANCIPKQMISIVSNDKKYREIKDSIIDLCNNYICGYSQKLLKIANILSVSYFGSQLKQMKFLIVFDDKYDDDFLNAFLSLISKQFSFSKEIFSWIPTPNLTKETLDKKEISFPCFIGETMTNVFLHLTLLKASEASKLYDLKRFDDIYIAIQRKNIKHTVSTFVNRLISMKPTFNQSIKINIHFYSDDKEELEKALSELCISNIKFSVKKIEK